MRKRNLTAFRVNDEELAEIKRMAEDLGCPRSEVWRRLLYTVRVLYDPDLTLSDVLVINERTMPIQKLLMNKDIVLKEAMRPIPQLIKILEAKKTMNYIERQKRVGASPSRPSPPRP